MHQTKDLELYSCKNMIMILHTDHPGITSMKSITRHYIWWEKLDKDVEKLVNRCIGCQKHRRDIPEVAVYPWNPPAKPWERVHLDFAGPLDGFYWLVGIDAYSKWIEIDRIKDTTRWHEGKIINQQAKFSYNVEEKDKIVRKHANQLRIREEPDETKSIIPIEPSQKGRQSRYPTRERKPTKRLIDELELGNKKIDRRS
ncbi:uncharacterized protein LOC135924854 [Gordionus sp. m RMFG-2023]|uniref:uncharacterized protein LOC135924854 n=1 Tax=Gordionus sp. m RMFG-2023 TaxID=3053472 RepID=UPI0031FBE683